MAAGQEAWRLLLRRAGTFAREASESEAGLYLTAFVKFGAVLHVIREYVGEVTMVSE
jgi:hypothetical protein